jgi:predicted PhzF superfamily epimerase YddE/YHI9
VGAGRRAARLHVLRVFCAEDGSGGNPLGVFLDGSEVPVQERQSIARALGFSETVFLDDRERGHLRIFTPQEELPLAGHPLVGTAWLMREQGIEPSSLRPPAGETPVRYEGDLTWVGAKPGWAPHFDLVQLGSPAEVEALEGPPRGANEVGLWAWADEAAGIIRERVFVPGLGIPEDEATGAAALRLCGRLGREIEIRQGRGSRILARPLDHGFVEIGGTVALDEVRAHG